MNKTSVEYRNPHYVDRMSIDEPEITLKNYRGIFHMRSNGMENIELQEIISKCLKSLSPSEVTTHLNKLFN